MEKIVEFIKEIVKDIGKEKWEIDESDDSLEDIKNKINSNLPRRYPKNC